MDPENLKNKYHLYTVLIKEERTIKLRKESLWKLANDLENAFNLPNPTTHELFKDAKEMNSKGFQELFSCYEKGKKKEKEKETVITVDNDDNNDDDNNDNNNDDNNGSNNNDDNRPVKRIYRRTTEDEKKLLEPILLFEEFPDNNEDVINDISQKLGPSWDLSRIKKYWANNNLFKFKKNK
ncbi:unnamed protein product [Rhizophagus irregularis]|nr:unnamed protein product [Rhizophagus irregularis]